MEIQLHVFITLALNGRDYIHTAAVLPKGKSLGYSLEGDQVNATAGLGIAGQGYWTDVACGAFGNTYIYIYICKCNKIRTQGPASLQIFKNC